MRSMTYHPTPTEALQTGALELGARGASAGSSHHAAAPLASRRRLNSQALMGNEREIEIEHSGQLYRLRLTSLGKLILTK